MDKPPVSVVGLGKLGAPMVACFASKGHQVTGVDLNPEYVRLINEGRTPVYEPTLAELLAANRSRISATSDCEAAVINSEITFIIVPTPSKPDGMFSLEYVQAACEKIGDALARKTDFHLVVLTSTVLPGDTEAEIKPLLETRSGKKCGLDFGLCYNPEFIALGSAIHDLLHPDFFLIGESDRRSGDLLEKFYEGVVGDGVPAARMNIVNAELTKIAVNTFMTTKITYANMLAEVCEKIAGCDVDVVTGAIGLDSRIGPKYLKGGLGYGGPCFPRDNVAFAAMARRWGATPTIAEATDAANRRQVGRLAERLKGVLPPGGRVGILGLAYKAGTNVVEESQGVQLAQALAARGIPVSVYDPLAMDNARMVLAGSVTYARSLEDCIQASSVVAITTPWEEFKQIRPAQLAHNPSRVVLDCWRILAPEQIAAVADYLTVGK